MSSQEDLGFVRLEEYERSEDYLARRDQIWLAQGRPGCFICGRTDVQMHHRSYARLGDEAISDLVALCEDHHYEIERRIRNGRFARPTAHLEYRAECEARSHRRLRQVGAVLEQGAPTNGLEHVA